MQAACRPAYSKIESNRLMTAMSTCQRANCEMNCEMKSADSQENVQFSHVLNSFTWQCMVQNAKRNHFPLL
jgi:hypothetical protein